MQQHVFGHLLSDSHDGFLESVSITFIEKSDPLDPLKREDYRRRTLCTMSPQDINVEESV